MNLYALFADVRYGITSITSYAVAILFAGIVAENLAEKQRL